MAAAQQPGPAAGDAADAANQTGSQVTLPAAPSAVQRPLVLAGGVRVEPATPGAIKLTLDDAVQLALRNNAEVVLRGQLESSVRGQILTVENALLPNLSVTAYTQAQEINLAAMGFKAALLDTIHIPGFSPIGFSTIVKVNTTDAQINLTQSFTVPALYLFRAAKKASEATTQETLNSRGGVVLAVGALYLRTLADQSQLRNALGLVRQDQVVLNNARASRDAGVGINLDVLRAQVQLQTEQQEAVRDEAAVAKDKIALNREMGQPAGQELDLIDTVPFAELQELTVPEAKAVAQLHRKDLLSLQAQMQVALEAAKAVKYERLPTVGIGGYYGVIGVTTGGYHGDFVAEGRVQFPIFQEAVLRGQREVASAQIIGVRRQIEATEEQIEADIRSSMLDVDSSRRLVLVARSNQTLAVEALSDATDRFNAGVDDSLPLVRAQAALVGAETQVLQAEFQYNYAKLLLARNTGVVESEYKQYLGR